jgi:hypothetical protein
MDVKMLSKRAEKYPAKARPWIRLDASAMQKEGNVTWKLRKPLIYKWTQ